MPLVSIVCATYNRSNILGYTLASACWQTSRDWELLVVGDACTDDTAAVVHAQHDDRIRFVNLPRNHGEQSAPNNAGVANTTGEFVAFLNHDDLWFPDHLSRLLAACADPRVDIAHAATALIPPGGRPHLGADAPDGRYAPWHTVPASTWLVRRSSLQRVGPWRSARDLYDVPSQDWLRRAHAAGLTIHAVPWVTVVQITSGYRRDSYRLRHAGEHAALFARMQRDPVECRHALLTAMAMGTSTTAQYLATGRAAREVVHSIVRRACVAVGVPPRVFSMVVRDPRKGGFIRHLRAVRGLPPDAIAHDRELDAARRDS
jgi:glycosyltransferase involved in cell wall biosynthesis